ncbi:MAG: hypothetical protein RL434_694 [Pseudomonadota bacterium]
MKAIPLLLPLLLTSCLAQACDGLVIEHPWIREAPPGARVMAGYAELRNEGSSLLVIDAAESPGYFDHVMIHETQLAEGRAHMVSRETLELAPGATRSVAPGGRPRRRMQPGAARALARRSRSPCGAGSRARSCSFQCARRHLDPDRPHAWLCCVMAGSAQGIAAIPRASAPAITPDVRIGTCGAAMACASPDRHPAPSLRDQSG